MVVLPPNILEGDASNVVSIKLKRITIKAPIPSRQVRAYTYIKYNRVNFDTHTFLGLRGLAPFQTQINLFAKFEIFILS